MREITTYGADTEEADRAVAACAATYATKSRAASGTVDRAPAFHPCWDTAPHFRLTEQWTLVLGFCGPSSVKSRPVQPL